MPPHLREKLLLIAVVALASWLMPVCPILWLLGIPCPGCGMTHAWAAALQLDLAGAFRLHPMFWSVPLLLLYLLYDWKLTGRRWIDRAVLAGAAGGFLVQWVHRLIIL